MDALGMAFAEETVREIMLDIDNPNGEVAGCFGTGPMDAIFQGD